jgi:hypothetical protein
MASQKGNPSQVVVFPSCSPCPFGSVYGKEGREKMDILITPAESQKVRETGTFE